MQSVEKVKQHFKMYKSGRMWMAAGITTVLLMAGYSPIVHGAVADASVNKALFTKVNSEPEINSAQLKPTNTGSVNTSQQSQVNVDLTISGQASAISNMPNVASKASVDVNSQSNNSAVKSAVQQSEIATQSTVSEQGATSSINNSATSMSGVSNSSKTPASVPSSASQSLTSTQSNSDKNNSIDKNDGEINNTPNTNSVSFSQQSDENFVSQSHSFVAEPASTSSTLNKSQTSQLNSSQNPQIMRATPLNFLAENETIDQWMPNKVLQQAVLANLRGQGASSGKTWASVNDITQQDMLLLKHLSTENYPTYIDGKTSFSLEGLQYATNLIDLNMNRKMQTRPAPEGLMTRGDITDLSPLKSLVNLQTLEFIGNRVTDISPIAGLKNITNLIFHDNSVADVSALNRSQYTQLIYTHQLIEQPLVRVSSATGEYTMNNPFKPAQGDTYTYLGGSGTGITQVNLALSDANNKNQWNFYVNGGASSLAGKDEIKFSQVTNAQRPGSDLSTLPLLQSQWRLENNLQYLPYVYYLTSNFIDKDGQKLATVLTPYELVAEAQDVTVNYVDEAGSAIADAKTLSGLIGDTYTSEALSPVPTGYELKETPSNVTGTFSDTVQTVTYVYKEVKSTVKVHYLDENGNIIKDDSKVSGRVGTTFDITHPDIAGYTYVSTTGTASGTYTKDDSEVTFVYKVAKSTITAHYKDENGNTIKADTTSSGSIGTDYSLSYPEIDGYTYQSTTGSASGQYVATDAEVTFVYRKNEAVPPTKPEQPVTPEVPVVPEKPKTPNVPETPVAKPTVPTQNTNESSKPNEQQPGTVKVEYVTDNHQEIAPTVTLTGKQGEAYTTSSATWLPAGYQLEAMPENANGTFAAGEQTVVYVYHQVSVAQPTSFVPNQVMPQTMPVSTAPKTITTAMPARRTTSHVLPQTDQKHAATEMAGLTLMGLLLGFTGFSKRRKRD